MRLRFSAFAMAIGLAMLAFGAAEAASRQTSVTVRSGDSLSAVASRTGSSMTVLAKANRLKPPYTLHAGQVLVVPGGAVPSAKPSAAAAPNSARPRAAMTAAESYGVVTVRKGDTATAIARSVGIPVATLGAFNGVKPPYAVYVGQRLRVPASAGSNHAAANLPQTQPRPHAAGAGAVQGKVAAGQSSGARQVAIGPVARDVAPPSRPGQASGPPRFEAARVHGRVTGRGPVPLDPAPSSVARTDAPSPVRPVAASGPAVSDSRSLSKAGFRWPVEGRVATAFGPAANGLQSNGVRIAAKRGATVRAAEAGEVAYVGRDMRGYGNLLLIKHGGDWLTTYGNLDALKVRRGQKVKRGDIIGSVGVDSRTGAAQLYVETRHMGEPVDPQAVLGIGRRPAPPLPTQQASR